MSVIKGVILSELSYGVTRTYLDSVPDLAFLINDFDIEITYNRQKLDEFSFSLEVNPGDKYDFVSLAVRDILKGLGLSSSFRYDKSNGALLNPIQNFTPFESFINEALGNYGNPSARYSQATKGSLQLNYSVNKSLTLYAPSPWQNGVSLNYFIPQDNSCVSQILSYKFCKGMVTRSLADTYSDFIFTELLGWKRAYTVGTSSPSTSIAGSTAMLMPYNGSITFNDQPYGVNIYINPISIQSGQMRGFEPLDKTELYKYVNSFLPFLHNGDAEPICGTSISVLKEDGSWDLVKFSENIAYGTVYNMTDWTFHFDESEYARTIDGYLRARITQKTPGNGTGSKYSTKFFVIDYLPQKVDLSYSFMSPVATRAVSSNNTVRLYFSNTEGINRLVIEKLRQGNRLPSRIVVDNIKKGYIETTIDRTTTFTAVGYNDNGTSRGIPITITPSSDVQSLDFILNDNTIVVNSAEQDVVDYSYTIRPLEGFTSKSKLAGTTSGIIDISELSNGLYVLTVEDNTTGVVRNFKFKK